jgi:hypothetical protein
MRIAIIALSFWGLAAIELKAQIKVKNYREAMNVTETDGAVLFMKGYLGGLRHGIKLANLTANKRFFCEPENLPLKLETYIKLLDRRIERLSAGLPRTEVDEMDIGILLIQELQDTFPCAKSK